MPDDVIKNNSNKDMINSAKTDINKQQIEESQKKSIQYETDLEKIINEKNDNPTEVSPVLIRDFSSRIKYSNLQNPSVTQYTDNSAVKIGDSNVVNHNNNNSVVKPNDNSSVIKHGENSEIIKSADNNGIVKPTDNKGVIKNNEFPTFSKHLTGGEKINLSGRNYNNASFGYRDISAKNVINENNISSVIHNPYSQDNGIIKSNGSRNLVKDSIQEIPKKRFSKSNKRNKRFVKSDNSRNNGRNYNNHNNNINYGNRNRNYSKNSNKNYSFVESNNLSSIVNFTEDNVNIRFKDNKIGKDVIKENKITESINKTYAENGIIKEPQNVVFPEKSKKKQSQNYSFAENNDISSIINFTEDNVNIRFKDNKIGKDVIKETKITESINKTYAENGIIKEPQSIVISEKNKKKQSKGAETLNKEYRKGLKKEKNPSESKKNYNNAALGYRDISADRNTEDIKFTTDNTAFSYVEDGAKETLRIKEDTVIVEEKQQKIDVKPTLAERFAEISTEKISSDINKKSNVLEKRQRTVKGDKRKIKIESTSTQKNSILYGIKDEAKNNLKKSVLSAGNNAHRLVNASGNAIRKSIAYAAEENSDTDMAVSAVNAVFKTVDTAKKVKKSKDVAVKIGHKSAKTISETIKIAKKAPSQIASSSQKWKNRINKIRKFKNLSKKHQRQYIKYIAKKGTKEVGKTVVNSAVSGAKGLVIKLLGGFIATIAVVIVIVGCILGILCTFMWNTQSDLDTTQMLKTLSELDYARQNEWFSKGNTAIELYEQNDRATSASYQCVYKLAVDVAPENPEIITGDQLTSDGAVMNVKITTNRMSGSGTNLKPLFSGFNKTFSSSDEMLENYRWTTDDYFSALAYLQVKNENLGWFDSTFGWAGEMKLKNSAKELHSATYQQSMVLIDDDYGSGNKKYSFVDPIYSTNYSGDDGVHIKYFFGRKFSVKYLIDNDIIKFDTDEEKNKEQKERFENICKYGNIGVAVLGSPLELDTSSGETITDRIVKHFGKQLVLEYTPPTPDPDRSVYGKVRGKAGYHYANDLQADYGDIIYAPIGGICKVTQRDERGFEYVISTSYTDDGEIDYTKNGYLVKMSCSSSKFISSSAIVSKGQALGKVAKNISANYLKPNQDNDTENEDIFANKLFPCSTGTDYQNLGANDFDEPTPQYDHLHIEMYKLPCDFTNAADIENNVLAPELFFEYVDE